MHYPTYDQDDPEVPFIEGIDHNANLEEDLENRSFEDRKVQHIDLRNVTFADAIMTGALSAKTRMKRTDNSAEERV